jgi:tRNA (guanosine-2'-O-)-methyltransferase
MTEERAHKIRKVLAQRQPDLTVVLENVFDMHNVSAIMRTCDAVGVLEIFVLNTRQPPHERWGYRSSSGAYKWIIVHQFEDMDLCLQAVRSKYSRVLTTHLSADAVSLYDVDLTQSTALVFGNEQVGISNELLAHSDGNIVIPQVGMIHSLNISVACAVSLYEAMRQKQNAGHYAQQKISEATFNEVYSEWTLHPRLR